MEKIQKGKHILHWTCSRKKVDYTKKYFYNDKGLVSKTITTGIGFTVGTAFYTYKYDDHGNWIQRIITIGNKKFYRGRLILYY